MAGPTRETGTVYLFDCLNSCILVLMLTYIAELSDSDEHFSDAQSGLGDSENHTPVRPSTQVEKVDPEPTQSWASGTQGYTAQRADVEPYEAATIAEAENLKKRAAGGGLSREQIANVVEPPSKGGTPGATAQYQRPEDAVSDTIVRPKGPISTGDSPVEVKAHGAKTEKSGEREELDLIEEARGAPGMVYYLYTA